MLRRSRIHKKYDEQRHIEFIVEIYCEATNLPDKNVHKNQKKSVINWNFRIF